MKTLVRWLCVLGLLAGLAPCRSTLAQGVSSAAVVGRVIDDAGSAVPSATLTLSNPSTGARYSARSADDGRFFFENVEVGGPYALDVRALGGRHAGGAGERASDLDRGGPRVPGPDRAVRHPARQLRGRTHQRGHKVRHQRVPRVRVWVSPEPEFRGEGHRGRESGRFHAIAVRGELERTDPARSLALLRLG